MTAKMELIELIQRAETSVMHFSLDGFDIGSPHGDGASLLYMAVKDLTESGESADPELCFANASLAKLIGSWLASAQGRDGLFATPEGTSHIFDLVLAPENKERFSGFEIAMFIGPQSLYQHKDYLEKHLNENASTFGDVMGHFLAQLINGGYEIKGCANYIDKLSDAEDIGLRYYALRNITDENVLHGVKTIQEQGLDYAKLQDRFDRNEFAKLIGRGTPDEDTEISYMGMALANLNFRLLNAMLVCGVDHNAPHFKRRVQGYSLVRLVDLMHEKYVNNGQDTSPLDGLRAVMASIDAANAAKLVAQEFKRSFAPN